MEEIGKPGSDPPVRPLHTRLFGCSQTLPMEQRRWRPPPPKDQLKTKESMLRGLWKKPSPLVGLEAIKQTCKNQEL